jgi:hypothetical protein
VTDEYFVRGVGAWQGPGRKHMHVDDILFAKNRIADPFHTFPHYYFLIAVN